MAFLFLLVPALWVMFRLRLKRQRRDMGRFSVDGKRRDSRYISMEPWRLGLLLVATSLIIVALTRPAINPHAKMIPREGRDVVFLLDVSRSMLAEDRLPNRLQSAKMSIAECVDSLEGHRVGLVVFAGSSSIVCPLTMDTDFFLDSLRKVGPDSVAHGGTRIADALLKVCDKLFASEDKGYKDIVLISDGGDQGKLLEKAIEQLNQKQIRLIALGLGDEKQGARVPALNPKKNKSDYMLYKGEMVWTKLDALELTRLVNLCDHGAYLPVGTRQMNLGQIYHRLSQQGGTQQMAEASVIAYDDIFPWFVAVALFLLMLMVLIPHTRKRSSKSSHSMSTSSSAVSLVIVAALCFQVFTVTPADASTLPGAGPRLGGEEPQDAQGYYVKGNQAYRAASYADAVSSYESALELHPAGVLLRDVTFNLGNAYFQSSKNTETSYDALSRVNQSISMYRKILRDDPEDWDAAVNNEWVRTERRKWEERIRKEEERRKQMQEALEAIRKKLIGLIDQQSQNLPEADEPKDEVPEKWQEKERAVAMGTELVGEMLNALNRKFFKGIPDDLTPVKESQSYTATALENQMDGLRVFPKSWADALAKGEESLQSLRDALAALPQEADNQGQPADDAQDQEGDDQEQGDSDDDGEGEAGDQESDDGELGEMESSDANQMDLEAIDLPPPSNSPDDIIRMSQEMQESRQASGAKKKGKPVDKNW